MGGEEARWWLKFERIRLEQRLESLEPRNNPSFGSRIFLLGFRIPKVSSIWS